MPWGLMFLGFLAILFILLAAGEWIAFALGTAGMIGLYLLGGVKWFNALGPVLWNNVNSFTMTAVPLFVFMGEVILRSGISTKFYRGLTKQVGRLPGGLLQTNIIACAFFAAISGSSVATAAAIGSVAVPEMLERKYNEKMIFGSLAAGGTLGVLIPPSIPLIVYGSLVGESVAKLFIAGFVPGIILALLFMTHIIIRCIFQRGLTPAPEKSTWKEKVQAIPSVAPIIILMIIILGGIYFGIMTPTEAAAVGAVVSLVIAALNRALNFKMIKEALINATRTTCLLLLIIVGAQILNFLLVASGINRAVTEWVVAMNLTPFAFFLVCVVIYLILGCLMEGLSMLFLTMPVLYPIVLEMGFDPLWFGIVLVVLIEIAAITPPVGMNLFVIHGIAKGHSIGEVIKGSMPYFFIMMLMIFMLYLFPGIVHWLPNLSMAR